MYTYVYVNYNVYYSIKANYRALVYYSIWYHEIDNRLHFK